MSIQDFLLDPVTILRLNATIRRGLEQRGRGGKSVARILIADDDPVVRRLLESLLEQAGHQVRSVENGREALELVDEGPPFDLVITDIQMPEVDGLELIRALRRRDPSPRIIAITSQVGRRGYLHAAEEFGADLGLVKPADLERMASIVVKVLGGADQ